MKFIALLLLVLAVTHVQAQETALPDAHHTGKSAPASGNEPHDVGPPDAVAQLRKLAAAYNQAMVKKDAATLLSFYYDKNVPVMGSVAPASFARMTAATNGKAPRVFPNSADKQSVADTAAQTTPEKVSHLTVHTDGTVAVIEYDYEIPQGYGHTYWTLVDTKDAWKITSVAYSMNMKPAAK
ncbi:MAG TPA: hypothetical protein VL997_00070 [Dyella sp.]|nr:hypothetical protein [Dyella sp.]